MYIYEDKNEKGLVSYKEVKKAHEVNNQSNQSRLKGFPFELQNYINVDFLVC